MRWREFIAGLGGTAAAWPLATRAQEAKTVKIGVLNLVNAEPFWTLLREGMRDLGYRAGQNLHFEFRSAEGNPDLLPCLAAELVRLI